jgi:hypothetical protein
MHRTGLRPKGISALCNQSLWFSKVSSKSRPAGDVIVMPLSHPKP